MTFNKEKIILIFAFLIGFGVVVYGVVTINENHQLHNQVEKLEKQLKTSAKKSKVGESVENEKPKQSESSQEEIKNSNIQNEPEKTEPPKNDTESFKEALITAFGIIDTYNSTIDTYTKRIERLRAVATQDFINAFYGGMNSSVETSSVENISKLDNIEIYLNENNQAVVVATVSVSVGGSKETVAKNLYIVNFDKTTGKLSNLVNIKN
ncbi:hypothetical protein RyT2_20300 [Pseudolactococcus yaeyamensis]